MGIPASEYAALLKKQKRNKYGNKPKIIYGIRFQSGREAQRYKELKLLEAAKEISDLKLQVPIILTAWCEEICRYIADFTYLDHKHHKMVIEDAKGKETELFKLKWKLLKAQFGDKYIYRIT